MDWELELWRCFGSLDPVRRGTAFLMANIVARSGTGNAKASAGDAPDKGGETEELHGENDVQIFSKQKVSEEDQIDIYYICIYLALSRYAAGCVVGAFVRTIRRYLTRGGPRTGTRLPYDMPGLRI